MSIAQDDHAAWNQANKFSTLYYATLKNKDRRSRVKIYRSMHAIHVDMSNCLKTGGVVTNICKVSKLVPVMTKESYRLSKGGM